MATMRLPEKSGFDDVFDAVDMGLIVLDQDGCVLEWNGWMAAAAAIPAEAARRLTLEAIFPHAVNARLTAAIADALSAGTSSILSNSLHSMVFPLKTRAGRVLIHNVSVRPIPGTPARCVIQVVDVTIAVERDRMLRNRQNARYDAVVVSAPDAILTLDTKGVIQFANPAAEHVFGYLARELVDLPISSLFADQPGWLLAWAALLAGDPMARPIELIARRKDGSSSFVEMSASVWRSDVRVFVTAILRDVNERHRAEHELRNLNQTLERRVAERTADRDRMWRLSSDVMLVMRGDGTINASNPAWRALLDGNEVAPINGKLADFVVEDDRPALAAAFQALASTRAPRRFELRLRTNDGNIRWISWSAVAADRLVQAVGRDVTAEREAEEALHRAEEALRQSQKMEAIGQLTGGIAHDFNNLLTGIIGSMDMLKRRIAAERYADVDRFMNAAVVSAERAAALTHRLLAFARRQPLNPQPIDVNQLIEGMAELLHRSLGEQIQLEISTAEPVWPIRTDANQLENALLNLAINARDAMPDGGWLRLRTANVSADTLREQRHDDIEPGNYTLICVTDTGIGMSPETAAKAFDPFFTTKPIGQGTGLGLSMIYGFVKQSRGHVRIESEIGQGTTISLFMPRHTGTVVLDQPEQPIETPTGAGEVVLLVEDEPSVRLLIGEVLQELGYACIEANDGQAALPILASHRRLDLMITDVGLPGMNGRQLAEIARQHRPELKVLFVTGYAEHATTRGGFLGAGMEMVTKPFALDALAKKIRDMFATRECAKLPEAEV
jgi:PAS domain S-box-containing protein